MKNVAYHKTLEARWCEDVEYEALLATGSWFDSPLVAAKFSPEQKEEKKEEGWAEKETVQTPKKKKKK